MTIADMHYDFKKKLNKIDTNQYRELLVPEIDWALNDAQDLFIKMVAQPRLRSALGVETSQRSIDDLREIIVRDTCQSVISNVAALPSNYMFFLGADVTMDKGDCTGVKGRLYIRQHDDEFEESPFDKSSFEWREVNGVFFENGVRVFDDGTFTITEVCFDYIRTPVYMHNANAFKMSQYTLPSGTLLSGTVDCELAEHTHREIVDLAVLIASGEIQLPDYQTKLAKLKFNQLIN